MTLLAAAGIYLVLDVNSPLVGQHLNRYEPWTTYNDKYISHVYKVVNEFSGYNNTLAFFAGNEIVNDKTSASNSPVYIKAVIRDMKHFIKENGIRKIPVGYSAADDLSYRISLAEYLECYESDPLETIDFYGVNTYQWCGEQTFYTSGYNHLVRDYGAYSKPIFFSEYGCNEVLPRLFKEVGSIYSNQMTNVFSGGLVYEFAQEPNNYGLVDYDEAGNVKLLPDFFTFKEQISKVKDVKLSKKLHLQNQQATNGKGSRKTGQKNKVCELQYSNLDISKGIPRSMGLSLVKSFNEQNKGKFVVLTQSDLVANYKVFSPDGSLLYESLSVKPVPEPIADPEDSISCEYCDLEGDENGNENEDKVKDKDKINKVPNPIIEPVIPSPIGEENDSIKDDKKNEQEKDKENGKEKNKSSKKKNKNKSKKSKTKNKTKTKKAKTSTKKQLKQKQKKIHSKVIAQQESKLRSKTKSQSVSKSISKTRISAMKLKKVDQEPIVENKAINKLELFINKPTNS